MAGKLVLLLILLPGAFGFASLMSYSYRAGDIGERVPQKLPDEAGQSNSGQPTVLFFYHPHCPCTRASVRCLERYCGLFKSNPKIIAYAFVPPTASEAWAESETTAKLRSLQDVEVIADPNATMCRRFDITTSGHVLVYNSGGSLLFSGGITASRGHEGNCEASDAFQSAVNGATFRERHWPVFGCAFFNNDERI